MPDKFILKIDVGNDAMLNCDDVADALEEVVARLRRGMPCGQIRDLNGNTVGEYAFTKGE